MTGNWEQIFLGQSRDLGSAAIAVCQFLDGVSAQVAENRFVLVYAGTGEQWQAATRRIRARYPWSFRTDRDIEIRSKPADTQKVHNRKIHQHQHKYPK